MAVIKALFLVIHQTGKHFPAIHMMTINQNIVVRKFQAIIAINEQTTICIVCPIHQMLQIITVVCTLYYWIIDYCVRQVKPCSQLLSLCNCILLALSFLCHIFSNNSSIQDFPFYKFLHSIQVGFLCVSKNCFAHSIVTSRETTEFAGISDLSPLLTKITSISPCPTDCHISP